MAKSIIAMCHFEFCSILKGNMHGPSVTTCPSHIQPNFLGLDLNVFNELIRYYHVSNPCLLKALGLKSNGLGLLMH
jgi:hypothetical protein